ncbi:MAG: transglycosylase domain-containing protein [Bacteroidales bacterium]|nr:transglycosylase domain-containing protein [Bacteroidales bacterium]
MKIKNRKRFLKWLWLIVFSPIILVLLLLLMVWIFADIPSFEELEDPQSNLATQIIADDGTLLNTYHVENRSYSNYEELSQNLKDALVATEDARFYDHSGIDGKSLVRVAVKSLMLGNRAEGGGGSTLSQQLAKSLFPRGEGKGKLKLITTKLKEWITAIKLERSYTKEEIMSMYLDAVFFGRNAYGIKSASSTFFGKLPKDLTVEEAALLVGMVNKPTKYNPVRNPELSLQRRNHVLKQMNKYGYLTDAQYDSIVKIPITLASRGDVDVSNGQAPYFRDMIKRIMSASEPKRSSYSNPYDYRQDSIRWKEDPLYGWLNKNRKPDGEKYVLEKDGLKIITPLNAKMQRYAEQAAVEHLKYLQPLFKDDLKYRKNFPFADNTPESVIETLMNRSRRWSDRYKNMKEAGYSEEEIEKSFDVKTKMRVFAWNNKGYIDTTMTPNDSILYFKSFLRTGLMAMEPETGYVRAYVGGANYNYFKYDQVMQGQRQVGSTFKPFLYTLAMQEGFTPCDVAVNLPQSFVTGNSVWTPKGGGNGATVTLKWGLTVSNNNISAYLMKQFGPDALVQMAHNMGLKCYLEPVYSLCVGSADVPVYQMVSAYNTFPSKGVFVEPVYVLRIEDKNGRVLTNFASRKREAIGANTAYTMIGMMRSVVDAGTGARLRRYIQGGEIAGKTGTTNDNSDGWFIGYVPRLTVGVWVGAEDRQVHFRWTGMGQGASVALPIWGLFMKKVLDDPSIPISIDDHFTKPQGYSIDCIPAHITSDPDVDGDNFIEEN